MYFRSIGRLTLYPITPFARLRVHPKSGILVIFLVVMRAKRARPTTVNRPGFSPLPLATVAKDRIGLLDKVSPHGLGYRQTRHQLTSMVEVDSESDTVVALRRSDSVKRSNFVRLREGVWLDDAIINFVFKQVL